MSAAAPAALRYVDDSRPGLARRRLPGGKFESPCATAASRAWSSAAWTCPAEDAAARRAAVVEVVKLVAARLANTPAVCRACYIHPGIVQAYLDGALPAGGAAPAGPRGLAADERRLLAFVAAWPDSEDR
ncbi:hypothetical protein [Bordetella bronchiseptica]|uniref:hypothetical protein n=1 Tax=Bordetella bronchiseptica TaxID=518 RepID=UPI000459DE42|nr:eukaryotic DNA topoisomerase I, catalytic core domain protein [Bordetella bronchiseptica OSU054]KDB72918.1 eukaryotic DNA topoisomerase I, catalytic core domain protein [Bordetella bronchiseptica CA90 BB1334]KDD47368.1 eukaryotic DNA topoisomerase I, catalytic core domain protein [Bordetella bronchiseptica OSU095]KDD53130.1 eukaryotic DNA topoisomerase I, catalytic core domain protein [Bordetella bronchiseptica OSU553]